MGRLWMGKKFKNMNLVLKVMTRGCGRTPEEVLARQVLVQAFDDLLVPQYADEAKDFLFGLGGETWASRAGMDGNMLRAYASAYLHEAARTPPPRAPRVLPTGTRYPTLSLPSRAHAPSR